MKKEEKEMVIILREILEELREIKEKIEERL